MYICQYLTPLHFVFRRVHYNLLIFGGNCTPLLGTLGGQLAALAEDNNLSVHAIDMPGVGENSIGLMQNHTHFIKAGILQVEHLHSNGVPYDKIILYGISMGAAIATITTAHLHAQNTKVSVFNDRSFSTFSATINGLILNKLFGYIVTPLTMATVLSYNLYYSSFVSSSVSQSLAYVTGAYIATNSLAKIALYITNWEMNAGNAYLSIPKYYKKLSYIENDNAITNHGGLYQVAQTVTKETSRISLFKTNCINNHFALPDEMVKINTGDVNLFSSNTKETITLRQELINFTAEVKIRNKIEALVSKFYQNIKIDDLAANETIIDVSYVNDLLNNFGINQSFTNDFTFLLYNAPVLAKLITREHKTSQSIKNSNNSYQVLNKFVYATSSLVYNSHEKIDIHLQNNYDLSNKIIEALVENIMDVLHSKGNIY